MQSRGKKLFKKIFKIFGWIIASVILLIVIVALLIQVPPIQSWITRKAVSFLETKIGTQVALGGIRISFPKNIVLEDIYFEDQQGDTLLYAGKLSVNTDLWGLTRNEIQLNNVALEDVAAYIHRAENDSAFNFTYILDAFAGDSTAVPDTLEQNGWNITLQTLELENIRVRFDDLLEGNSVNLSLGVLELDMESFDLENNRYAVESILLENTTANVEQSKILTAPKDEEDPTTDSAAALIFSLGELTFRNLHANYKQKALGQSVRLDVGEVRVLADKIDLIRQEIDLNTFSIRETFLAYHKTQADTILPVAKTNTSQIDTAADTKPWKLALAKLEFTNNSVQYYDFTKPYTKGSVDFDHLWLTGFNISAENLFYDLNRTQVKLNNLSLREQSGFIIRSLKGNLNVTSHTAILDNILLLTGNSRLKWQARAEFASLQSIADTYPEAEITSNISNSFVNLRDILYFSPTFLDSLPLKLSSNTNLVIDAAVSGKVSDLKIEHLDFRSLSETHLKTSGRVVGLPEAESLTMDISLDKLYTTGRDLRSILPDTLLPDSIQLPLWMNLQGRYTGTLEKADFNTALTSNLGGITARGNMNLDSTSALRGMDLNLDVNDMDIGTLLGKPDTVMGALAMQVEIHGNGLSPKEMTGTLAASVNYFEFQNYQYKDLRLDGTIRDQILTVAATMDDPNLDFTIDADYIFKEEIPRYDFTFDLKNSDFEALNLSKSPIRARGILDVDMATSDFKVLNGNVGIRKVAIFNGEDFYAIDSLLFASIDQKGRSEIKIDSDLLKAQFVGSINIFGLPGLMREYFNTYYSLHDSLEVRDSQHQHFKFEIQLQNTDLLTGLLVPNLTTFVPGPIKGEFDSRTQNLELKMEIADIQYSNIGIKSMVMSANSDAGALRYNLAIDKILVDSMKIDGLEFNGSVANNSISTDLIILDSTDRKKYILAGTFFSRENHFELKLAPEGIMLNYQTWSVPTENYIRFGGPKLIAQNVQLVNRREKILIQSDEQPGTPISIGFRELNLEYLTSIIAEERIVSGLLQGDIELYPEENGMTFTSDLTIEDFRIKNTAWGNLALQVEQKVVDRFDVKFGLTGNQNNVTINGFYLGGESPSMDLTANVNQFHLASMQPLLIDQVKNLEGLLAGNLRIRGTAERPDIDGRLMVSDTKFFSTYLNTGFSIDSETISFLDEGIAFNTFEIADENQNKARLDGTILTRTYRDFKFNLDLFTDNFRLLNTTEGANDLFYGKVDIKVNAKIRGNMTTPVVNMDIGLSDGSNVTYIVPQSEASAMQAEGIVKFVDKSFEGDPFMRQINAEAADTLKSTFRGIDLTARIELTDQEKFTIIIDPLTQDQLTISGNTTLTLKIDPTGDMNLTGRYQIEEGTYNLSFYKFVKREFNIEKGSSITWLGDPLNAQMDIRAIYHVETSPIELFSNQLTGADPNEVNQYKQRLPFLVYLNLSGELLQPAIGFKLEMPMNERDAFGGNVYARLQDINTRESDLNKQVFALLILKRFISDNPFENQGGGGFESTARNSVSKILSDQLNRLSENIKGVELSFDIKSYEDYTSGQAQGQTELQLGVSKALFNDRLVVKVSGNLDVEGKNTNRDATDYIGDLALEYKMTPDGRFRITGFRNSNYDMIDGELIETGTGLIYVKDYNALSELFKSNADTQN